MPRPGPRAVPDLDDLFTTAGFLRDTNTDGYADDLRTCVVLADEPDAETWSALLDLAARLGLETSGISFPLFTEHPPEDTLPIIVRHGRAGQPEIDATAWGGRPGVVTEGPAAIRALARLGRADRRNGQPGHTDPAAGGFDLSALFETSGLLTADVDLLPVGTRLCVVVPANLPRGIGVGLFHFVARMAMESGGIDLPIATTGLPSAGTFPLRIRCKEGYLARLSIVDGDPETGPSLELFGDPEHAGDLLDRLARGWPYAPSPQHQRDLHETTDWLRRSLAGWTAEGRLAALHADLATMESSADDAPHRLRLLAFDPEERARQTRLAREALGANAVLSGAGPAQRVFAQEWSARWEVDRALDVLRDRILPHIIRGLPFRLTLMVSEPKPIRDRLRADALRLLIDTGMRPQHCDVAVLDVFKAGLCWLREVVLPEWAASDIEAIEHVAIFYRPLDSPGSPHALDLRIRWLQELFPADEIVAAALGLPLDHVTLAEWGGDALYRVEARAANGTTLAEAQFSPLTYERPYLSAYPDAGTVHVVTGGVVLEQVGQTVAERVPTDLDLFWDYFQSEALPRMRDYILTATDGHPRRADQPFFAELRVDVTVSESDEPFGIREERHSAAEALHEDIYFNALDLVEALGQHTTEERLNAPGAILPFVRVRAGLAPSARVSLTSRSRAVAEIERDGAWEPLGRIEAALIPVPVVTSVSILNERAQLQIRIDDLDDQSMRRLKALGEIVPGDRHYPALLVAAPDGTQVGLAAPGRPAFVEVAAANRPIPDAQTLSEDELHAQLQRLARRPGVRFYPALDWSWEGRPIPAVEVTAPMAADVWSARKLSLFKPTFLIVARHHANEVASTTAALQLIEHLVDEPEWRWLATRVNLAILPFENPDGAALHDLLRRENPTWKHHPARYNAVGFEFAEDHDNPDSPYGEARVRDRLWHRWLPDIVVDNHGVPSHEWAQIFAGFGSPRRFTVSYWLVQALIYGIIPYVERAEHPEHRAAAFALRDAVARAVASDAEILELNRRYRERYVTWGASRVPERFPIGVYREMIFAFGPYPEERLRARRSYTLRYPGTTVASWVSEVADETAVGAQLRRTARAHLLVNRATLELLAAAATPPERRILIGPSGTRITLGRRRPIRLGP